MAKLISAFIIGLLLLSQSATAQNTTTLSSEELASRTVYRRAMDAVIWGLPLAGEATVKQAAFRDGLAVQGFCKFGHHTGRRIGIRATVRPAHLGRLGRK